MSDLLRTRIVGLKHKISAHSITDKDPVFDEWHYYTLAQKVLDKKFSRLISNLNVKEIPKFHVGIPKFYLKNIEISKGNDDDIVNGRMTIFAKGNKFPEIELKFDIEDRKLELPESFKYKSKEYDFTPEGFYEFLMDVNPRYDVDSSKYPYPMASGAKVETMFFGDDSKDREDLLLGVRGGQKRKKTKPEDLAPVETGDEAMWVRSVNFVGV